MQVAWLSRALLAGVLIAALPLLHGCGDAGGAAEEEMPEIAATGFSELTDNDLQDRSNVCRGIVPSPSGGAADAMICINVQNECLLRRRNGHYVC